MSNLSLLKTAFLGIACVLVIASLITLVLSHRHPERNYQKLKLRIKTWWWLVAVFFVALNFNVTVSITIFGIISFMAFKEFLTIAPIRQKDHRVLMWAYVSIPVQYLWVGMGWYGMFIIFIPVYMFLFLPMRMVLIGETQGYLRAAGTIQWGLMTTVFSISHMAYLLNMPILKNSYGAVSGEMLIFFLLLLTQANDVAQYLWGKMLGKHKVIPKVSPNKTVEGLLGGIATTTVLSAFLAPWFTPMSLIHSIMAGVLISVAGFIGDVVISAVKRDIGIKDTGSFLPGHGGILDRLDSLTYTAPIFFHFLHYYYY